MPCPGGENASKTLSLGIRELSNMPAGCSQVFHSFKEEGRKEGKKEGEKREGGRKEGRKARRGRKG